MPPVTGAIRPPRTKRDGQRGRSEKRSTPEGRTAVFVPVECLGDYRVRLIGIGVFDCECDLFGNFGYYSSTATVENTATSSPASALDQLK